MKIVLLACWCLAAVYCAVVEEQKMDHKTFDEEVLEKEQLRELKTLSPQELAKEIEKLVERMDTDDDGRVSKVELEVWLLRVEDNTHRREAATMFDKEDRNKDGFITFNEYWQNEEDDDAPIHKDDRDEETNPTYAKFMGADANHDGRLDLDEFVPFIHPFRHDHMIVHLINDQLTMYDYNKDGSISLDEFLKSFLQDGEEPDKMPEWLLEEKRDFEEHLDKDGDKILDTDEIREWVAPSEGKFREEEVTHLFKHADLNQDGYLSVLEVREELDIFINSPATDYGYTIHDEL